LYINGATPPILELEKPLPGVAPLRQWLQLRNVGAVVPRPTGNHPTGFGELAAQAGTSNLRHHGKLVRGGMGTSMPYFGTLYTQDEL
jgi:hypothetical protein